MTMPASSACAGGAHAWSEWRYSESAAAAVRSCNTCGLVKNRRGDVVEEPTAASSPVAGSAETVMQALGDSMFAEELKGNLAEALERANAAFTDADTTSGRADALITWAFVSVLRGEPAASDDLSATVASLAPGDANRRLRALTCEILATFERYNTFPDGAGAGATDVNARWQGNDLMPVDAEWQAAMKASSDPLAQFEAWLTYSFLCQLQPMRYTLDRSRYMPLPVPREEFMSAALSAPEQLRTMAAARSLPRLKAFADWAMADLQRRAGDMSSAAALLQRARASYHEVNDSAGEALCAMTQVDWRIAPFSSPLVWNFAVVDSSSQGSNLAVQLEADEFGRGGDGSYDEADALFRQAGAGRGCAAIDLRRAYQAMLVDDWPAAAAAALRARDAFATCGDGKGEHLAATHLLLCQLAGAGASTEDAWSLARAIGSWGASSGNFSFTVGLGIFVNRCSRHWVVRRGHYERALDCSRAAQMLFEELGADVNAVQCVVDQGSIHQSVGERRLALPFFFDALERYTALVAKWPRVAENLQSRVTFLAADVFQLALQQSDSDGMTRAAARLQQQLPDITFPPLRQMAAGMIAQSSVLAPLYRARVEKGRGYDADAARLIDEAETALSAIPEGERAYLEAAVLAERKDYPAAAEAITRHLAAGGANAGFVGELTKLMKAVGGAHGAAEARLQERRTHEQAFTAFAMVHAYPDAHDHWLALERLDGPEWWRSDSKPWLPLSDAGLMFEGLGQPARAFEFYDRAIQELEARRQSLSRDELKVALASDKGAQYLYFLAAKAAVLSGDATRGFIYAERGKSRALLDLMASVRTAASPHDDPAVTAWREANMQLLLHRSQLSRARAESQPAEARIAALDAQVRASEATLVDAEQALARVNPRFYDVVTPAASISGIEDVARQLGPTTVLLEYLFLGDDLLVWAIAPGREPVTHHATLDTALLARQMRDFRHLCGDGTPAEAEAEALSAILLTPLADTIRASGKLVIVPHGAAHLLPFHALPFDGAPLGMHRPVSYLPSASTLQYLNDSAPPASDRILVIGNPTGDLASAREEAEFVARQFPAPTLLLGGDATEDAVRRQLPSHAVVHFATHGELDEEVPLNSAVLLANDSRLTVYELMLMRLQARLVVLSACSTGQGETTGGDDVVGLTRGLLAAGARAAVVSLWPVDDASTGLFMETFYQALRAGASPAAALQAAQQRLLGMTARGYQNPYYWAPFIVVGYES